MIGDVVIVEDKHRKIADEILPIILEKKVGKFVLAIGGESGTGKTEVAQVLRDICYDWNVSCQVIHMDNYYKTLWNDRNLVRRKTGVVGPSEIDWVMLNAHIVQFKDCVYGSLRQINKFIDGYEYSTYKAKKVRCLIVEDLYGCGVEQADLRVHIEGTYKDTEAFRKRRNKEIIDDLRKKVLEAEHEAVSKLKEQASLVIGGKNV